MLCANLAINGFEQVAVHWAAAGAAPGQITVPQLDSKSSNNFGGLSFGSSTQGDRVALMTLDSFELQSCHLVKIDVEGMETEVLRGATATILRHKPVLYVENDRK